MTADAALESWRSVDPHPADKQFDKKEEKPKEPEPSRMSEVSVSEDKIDDADASVDALRKQAIEDQAKASDQASNQEVGRIRSAINSLRRK